MKWSLERSGFREIISRLRSRGARLLIPFVIFGVLMATGCKPGQDGAGPVYQTNGVKRHDVVYYFAVHPLHNPVKLEEAYQPLLDDLNKHLSGVTIDLEASRDYAQFEQKIRDRKPELILPNPWQTLGAMEAGYHVVAMAGAPEDFKGLIIVRKDSDIKQPSDLKGRSVSYPSSTALAACIMPQFFLHHKGVAVKTDIDNHYVGSQESSIMNVYLKLTAAGATWPQPWRAFQREHPAEALELKVIWETDSLINNSVMIRNDIPARLQGQVADYLIHLDQTADGHAILENIGIDRFRVASDRDYEVVRQYVAEFEGKVRKIVE